jgi:ABC-type amino acid transport substrate-binding protein
MYTTIRNRLLGVIILMISIWGFFSYFGLLNSPQEDREKILIVGLQNNYPPFEFIDGSKNLAGFDIDVAKLIATKLHRQLVIKELKFDELIPNLKQGKIDIIISGMNITTDRLEEIAMVAYHGATTSSLRLLFWNTIPEKIKTLRDIALLPSPKVCVEKGSVCEQVILNHKDLQCVTYQGATDPLDNVKNGISTSILVEKDVAEYLQIQHPELRSLRIQLTPEEQIMGFGIGIKKSHALLVHQVTELVESLKDSLKELEDKWFKTGIETSQES